MDNTIQIVSESTQKIKTDFIHSTENPEPYSILFWLDKAIYFSVGVA